MTARVMVVDDEPLLRKALVRDLQRVGYATVAAQSGHEAGELARREPMDLVISDVRMADGDGIELLTELKRDVPELPVILLTGYSELGVLEALRRGAEMMFSKPYERQALHRAVASALLPRPRRWWTDEPSVFGLSLIVEGGERWQLGSSRGPGACAVKLELEKLSLRGEPLPAPSSTVHVELTGLGERSGRIVCAGTVLECSPDTSSQRTVQLARHSDEGALLLAELINQQRTGGDGGPR